ncbi:hypothetical protein E2562_015460 [Oryza meyeriana var. granulata]|uniref:Uncharacterized protein n=1 Tax=Oryza meyeriana var. granulata TaxID=110450 RepID=A0A6G1BXG2_9ORYZ|nr:hypothetical protein E2562_015460 [Oryza meyeriana var. granulata]
MDKSLQETDPVVFVVTVGVRVGIAMGGVTAMVALSRNLREAWAAGMRRLRMWALGGRDRTLDEDETLSADTGRHVCRLTMVNGVACWRFLPDRSPRAAVEGAAASDAPSLETVVTDPRQVSSGGDGLGGAGPVAIAPGPGLEEQNLPPPSTPSSSADTSGLEEPLLPPSASPCFLGSLVRFLGLFLSRYL